MANILYLVPLGGFDVLLMSSDTGPCTIIYEASNHLKPFYPNLAHDDFTEWLKNV